VPGKLVRLRGVRKPGQWWDTPHYKLQVLPGLLLVRSHVGAATSGSDAIYCCRQADFGVHGRHSS
jgi:hypothetical protein